MSKFKIGDEVIVLNLYGSSIENGWIGPVVKIVSDERIQVDMSKYDPAFTHLGYNTKEVRKLTKLERVLK